MDSCDLVDFLAHSGADIDLPSNRDLSPLALAVKNGNIDVVRHLLQIEVDTIMCDVQENNALVHAVVGGQIDIAQMFTKVNNQNFANEAPINVSAMYGSTIISKSSNKWGMWCKHNIKTWNTSVFYSRETPFKCAQDF